MTTNKGWDTATVFNDLLRSGAGDAALSLVHQQNRIGRVPRLPSMDISVFIALLQSGARFTVVEAA